MTQTTPPPEGDAALSDASANAVPPELQALIDAIQKDPARTAAEIKALRAEAKDKREAAKESDRRRQAQLEADAKWQEAAQGYKQQLDDALPKVARVETYEQFLSDMAERRVKALPKQYQSLVPDYDDPLKTLAWLEANESVLRLPTPPDTGAGVRGDTSGANNAVAKLTPEAQAAAQIAKNYGYSLTAEQIAARQKQIEQDRRQPPEQDK